MSNTNSTYTTANKELEEIEDAITKSAMRFAELYSKCPSDRLLKYTKILHKTLVKLDKVQK